MSKALCRAPGERSRAWAAAALLGIVIYIALDVVLAFLNPAYSLIRNPESDYGAGAHGWIMDVNFLLRCAFSLCAAVAIARAVGATPRRNLGLALLLVWAVLSGLLALFPDNPAGTPVTRSGQVHLTLAVIAFVSVAAAAPILSGLLSRAWFLAGLAWAGVLAVLAVLLIHVGAVLGLIERVFLGLEIIWILSASALLYRSQEGVPTPILEPDTTLRTT